MFILVSALYTVFIGSMVYSLCTYEAKDDDDDNMIDLFRFYALDDLLQRKELTSDSDNEDKEGDSDEEDDEKHREPEPESDPDPDSDPDDRVGDNSSCEADDECCSCPESESDPDA